jgi:predicted DNA-binding protein (MmcQ/YjbR family)
MIRGSWGYFNKFDMDIESIRHICKGLPAVTEGIKWGNDLCFMIGEKMFCVAGLDQQPLTVSLKVTDSEFEELSSSPGIIPAPYVARYKWILVEDANRFSKKEWEHYIAQSYNLVKAKLPKKTLDQLK